MEVDKKYKKITKVSTLMRKERAALSAYEASAVQTKAAYDKWQLVVSEITTRLVKEVK